VPLGLDWASRDSLIYRGQVRAAPPRRVGCTGQEAAHRREHRTPGEQARWENHVRFIIPLDRQLAFLHSARFAGIDIFWKKLENVIYGGYRPE
jgi:hypothetical protein